LEENIIYHNIILENRKNLSIQGVKECLSFDEETIILLTTQGKLTIKGIGLHIENYNTEKGELNANGKFTALVYNINESSGGFFSKIFK